MRVERIAVRIFLAPEEIILNTLDRRQRHHAAVKDRLLAKLSGEGRAGHTGKKRIEFPDLAAERNNLFAVSGTADSQ